MICTKCKKQIKGKDFFYIDGSPVCYKCIFGDIEPVFIYPIGFVKFNQHGRNAIIRLYPQQERFMHRLEDEREICVIYYLHEINSIKTVFNRGRKSDGKEVGVFASRTPHRTSRIGITNVGLLSISGLDLYVSGLDAFEGSPVLDIKVVQKRSEKTRY